MTNLDELPAEVLHRISEYLPAKDAWSNLRPVSKKTDQKLSAVSYWANQIQVGTYQVSNVDSKNSTGLITLKGRIH